MEYENKLKYTVQLKIDKLMLRSSEDLKFHYFYPVFVPIFGRQKFTKVTFWKALKSATKI